MFSSFFCSHDRPFPPKPLHGVAEKATAEGNNSEQWQAIMDFSDMLNAVDENGRSEAVRALRTRLAHRSQSVVLQTITVRDDNEYGITIL